MIYANKTIGTVAYLGGLMAVAEEFCWSWSQMIQYNNEYLCEPGQEICYKRAKFSFHAAARNQLCAEMRGDWILMLDTDHSFDPDILARMLIQANKSNLEVLTALYHHRSSPHCPVLYAYDVDSELFRPIGDWDKPAETYLIPVASAGAGTLFIRRSVLKRIKDELNEGPFDIISPLGEDHSFFKRLIKLGIKAYCNPDIQSFHLQIRPISIEDYDPSMLNLVRA